MMTDIILGREARWHGQQRPSVIGWVPKVSTVGGSGLPGR